MQILETTVTADVVYCFSKTKLINSRLNWQSIIRNHKKTDVATLVDFYIYSIPVWHPEQDGRALG